MKESTRIALQSSMKSQDTEEPLDIWFYRPMGYWWAMLFKRMGVHPNVITLFSILLGCSAGLLFYSPHLHLNVVGMLLLVWANTYDSADGQLARLTGQKTRWGRILDGFAGDTWFAFINLAVAVREVARPIPFTEQEWGVLIFIIASFSGFSFHARQSRLADYYRNIHLYFLKGGAGSELDNSIQQKKLFDATKWRKEFFWKLFLNSYVDYTKAQEDASPAFQRFFTLVKARYGDRLPQSLRDAFRQESLPLMKYTNILTFNTRCIFLFICMFVGEMWLYFAFEMIVLTVVYLYMNRSHEKMCNRLYDRVTNGEFDN